MVDYIFDSVARGPGLAGRVRSSDQIIWALRLHILDVHKELGVRSLFNYNDAILSSAKIRESIHYDYILAPHTGIGGKSSGS
ncbi:hypothetical protein FB451DRAFT_1386052 [Mycena latifolia]|nr:hypothetical protein FB451DRAFT_1386052 [Mycena latifolia]